MDNFKEETEFSQQLVLCNFSVLPHGTRCHYLMGL